MATDAQVERLALKVKDACAASSEIQALPDMVICRTVAQYLIDNGAWAIPETSDHFELPHDSRCIGVEAIDKMAAKRKEMLG